VNATVLCEKPLDMQPTKSMILHADSSTTACFVAVQWLGKLSFVLVPLLVLLAVLVGAFAAKTYDSGASTFLAP